MTAQQKQWINPQTIVNFICTIAVCYFGFQLQIKRAETESLNKCLENDVKMQKDIDYIQRDIKDVKDIANTSDERSKSNFFSIQSLTTDMQLCKVTMSDMQNGAWAAWNKQFLKKYPEYKKNEIN
jgi:hypothetical protein